MAGLLSSFFGTQAQAPGQSRGLGGLLDPEIALPMAAALMGNQGNVQNVANAFSIAGPVIAQRSKTNQTRALFERDAPDLLQALDGGMPMDEAWRVYSRRKFAEPTATSDAYKVVDGRIFNTADQSWIEPPAGSGNPETGLNPQLMQDENGALIYVQPTKDGRLVQSKGPEGYRPVSPYDKSLQTAAGKNDADMVATMGSDISTAERTVQEVDQLIAHPGLNAVVGPMDQYRPSWTMGADGRDALARYNQLKGRAFLQAFATLKGGGQITEVEGQKATEAMARMDRAQDEESFRLALRDFRDAVDQGMRKLRAVGSRLPDPRSGSITGPGFGGQAMSAGGAMTSGNRTSGGVQWSIEP